MKKSFSPDTSKSTKILDQITDLEAWLLSFKKVSPVAADFSRAFLELSEKGTITDLENHWFRPTPRCSNSDNNIENGNLSLSNFWGLLLVTGITSTMMLILYLCRLIAKFRRQSASSSGDLREQFRRFISYLVKNQVHIP